jgi:hypothetical protein
MKTILFSITYLISLSLLTAGAPLEADPAVQPLSGSYGQRSQQLYQHGKASQIEGKILSMDTLSVDGEEPGVRLRVDIGNGEQMDVHLGPRWFLNQQSVNLTEGEPVGIVGMTIRLDDHPAMVAREVLQGNRRIPLRTPAGAPLWQSQEKKP